MVIKVHIPREMHYTYSENGKHEWGQSTVIFKRSIIDFVAMSCIIMHCM